MFDWTEIVLLLGSLVGALIAVGGIWRRRVSSLALGACIVSYSFTGMTYVPLLRDQPLSVMDRMWGASTAVLAGAALVGVLVTMRTGETVRGQERLRLWSMITGMAALLSLAGIYYSLRRYALLPPSTDFLNAYAHLTGVAIYQGIFAIWISLPATALGITALTSPQLGGPRWIVCAGGIAAALWGLWKIIGVGWNLAFNEHIKLESPVSVLLGLSALVLCVTGMALVGLRGAQEARRNRQAYLKQVAHDDALFRFSGTATAFAEHQSTRIPSG